MKVIAMVIDSFGCGEMPDAYKYGDEGSNTFVNIEKARHMNIPNMTSLGIKKIDGVELEDTKKLVGSFGRMYEKVHAKDTLSGHYEMMGIVLKHPNPTFPNGFPEELIAKLTKAWGVNGVLGNKVASGTAIIDELGKEHLETKRPIIYTSADSVLQIAVHTDVYNNEQLYDMCEKARKLCVGKYNVARVIARPFATNEKGEFYRTEDRKDYALLPPKKSTLDKLKKKGLTVWGIGKIEDVFMWQGLTNSIHTKNNVTSLEQVIELSKQDFDGFVFANLVDTDMLYGHRNDVEGYAKALEYIDTKLPTIMKNLSENDVLIVTADHGCDPTTPSTDHSREYVPILVYGKNLKSDVNLHTLFGFDTLGKSVMDYLGVKKYKYSFLRELKK